MYDFVQQSEDVCVCICVCYGFYQKSKGQDKEPRGHEGTHELSKVVGCARDLGGN